ncbi:hypothetical protein OROGR_022133 [Orobanche gracilis]
MTMWANEVILRDFRKDSWLLQQYLYDSVTYKQCLIEWKHPEAFGDLREAVSLRAVRQAIVADRANFLQVNYYSCSVVKGSTSRIVADLLKICKDSEFVLLVNFLFLDTLGFIDEDGNANGPMCFFLSTSVYETSDRHVVFLEAVDKLDGSEAVHLSLLRKVFGVKVAGVSKWFPVITGTEPDRRTVSTVRWAVSEVGQFNRGKGKAIAGIPRRGRGGASGSGPTSNSIPSPNFGDYVPDELTEEQINEMFEASKSVHNIEDNEDDEQEQRTKPKQRKPSELKSPLYAVHYSKMYDVASGLGHFLAKCNYCDKICKFKKGGGYGTLNGHIQRQHPDKIGIESN